MKNNSAFTLVELIGVIIVMVLIAAIAVPSVIKMGKNNDNKEYDNYVKTLIASAETYITLNIRNYPQLKEAGHVQNLLIETLYTEGYLNATFINPKTKSKPNSTEIIKITVNVDKTLRYEYIPN